MNRIRFLLTSLEDRTVPASGVGELIALGPDAGGLPEVRLLDMAGTQVGSFLAYDSAFRGGVRTAVGDVTGDGRPDIVTVPGVGGGPQVKIFDGNGGAEVGSFFAYDPDFRGGVSIDTGVLGGRPVIVTGQGLGGTSEVRVFDGTTRQELLRFNAYDPAFTGGVNVAVGDVLGGGRNAQIITAPGVGGGPHVKVFSGVTGQLLTSFFAYEPEFRGGMSVAAGNVVGLNGRDAVVTGAGPGGGPRVNVLDARSGQAMQSRFAYDPAFTGGVTVGTVRGLLGTSDRVLTAAGPGGGSQVNLFNPATAVTASPGVGVTGGLLGTSASFFALPQTFTGGVGLGSGFGLSDSFAPAFSPFFGGTAATTAFASPNFITNNQYVSPTLTGQNPGGSIAPGTGGVGVGGVNPVGSGVLLDPTQANTANNLQIPYSLNNNLYANQFGFVNDPMVGVGTGASGTDGFSVNDFSTDGFNFFDSAGTYNGFGSPYGSFGYGRI